MIAIIDSSSGQQCDFNENIDRAIYTRLQSTYIYPLGSLRQDKVPPISTFIEMAEKINSKAIEPTEADKFLGELGVTMIYPHRDNTFTGELKK